MQSVLILVWSLHLVWTFPSSTLEPSSDPILDPSPDSMDPGAEQNLAPGCPPCDPHLCPPAVGCRAGVVQGVCGCCEECGNILGQSCDPGPEPRLHGLCGTGMRCAVDPRPGARSADDQDELLCVCDQQEALCGSDGNTYRNRCEFREAAFFNLLLRVKGKGPCKTVPIIKVPPQTQVNSSGSLLLFLCEVYAFPAATVEWRKEGQEGSLPGDDPHLSVQSRGGPLKFELSSWLQIERAGLQDAGTYQCVARNKLGTVSASAQLRIMTQEDLSSYLANSISEMNQLLDQDYDQDLY
ncbi:kazal-type serine protease inhibitor domain-containing protein 1-like [Periophthalmus magnuspinnatus]|uniref:kazal-type serine protease inhibitor domain-containing protein 1-like n=1 Tax=Periophthalmus magnuspinnatus TaxID=409849 RepID=UPI00145B24BF|nr:kazal-type serine protease inhibitor domain-containing protein 1-like [Periophthalmus magnuspinnatus]